MASALLCLTAFVLFVCAVRVVAVQLKPSEPKAPTQSDTTDKNSLLK